MTEKRDRVYITLKCSQRDQFPTDGCTYPNHLRHLLDLLKALRVHFTREEIDSVRARRSQLVGDAKVCASSLRGKDVGGHENTLGKPSQFRSLIPVHYILNHLAHTQKDWRVWITSSEHPGLVDEFHALKELYAPGTTHSDFGQLLLDLHASPRNRINVVRDDNEGHC